MCYPTFTPQMSVIIRGGDHFAGKIIKAGSNLDECCILCFATAINTVLLIVNIILKDKPVLGDWLVGRPIIVYLFSREFSTNIEQVKDCFRVGSALLTIELWEFLDMTHLL